MGDDHVAEGAGFLVEAAPHLDRERLRDVDLDVVDVVAVPDRLEHAVGEAQRQQVLHRLAAEVVVDPVDAALVEDRVQARVRASGRGEVGAERLLGDHPGAARRGRARRAARPSLRPRSAAARGRRGPRPRRRAPRGRRRPRRRAASKPSPTPAKRSESAKRSHSSASSDLAPGALDRFARQLAELLDLDPRGGRRR